MYRKMIKAIIFLALAPLPTQARIFSDATCALQSQEVKLENFYPRDTQSSTISPIGQHFIQINTGGNAIYWTLTKESGRFRARFDRNPVIGQTFLRAKFSPKSNYAILDSTLNGTDFGKLALIRLSDAAKINEFNTIIGGPDNWGSVFVFSPSERYLAYMDSSNQNCTSLSIYDMQNGSLQKTFLAGTNPISGLAFHPNEQVIATKNFENGTITLWNIATGKAELSLAPKIDFSDPIWTNEPSIVFSEDASFIATHSTNIMAAGIWDLNEKTMIYKTSWIKAPIRLVPQTPFYMIGEITGAVSIWNTKSKSVKETLYPIRKYASIASAGFSPNNQTFVVGGWEDLVVLAVDSFSELCRTHVSETKGFQEAVFQSEENFYTISGSNKLTYWTIR